MINTAHNINDWDLDTYGTMARLWFRQTHIKLSMIIFLSWSETAVLLTCHKPGD